jgi:hypothetical protein
LCVNSQESNMNQQVSSGGFNGYSMPVFEAGVWGTAGGFAVRESLSRGSSFGVMDVLYSMEARDMTATLREVGFLVSPGIEERGGAAVLAAVDQDLKDAIKLRVDGYGLKAARGPVGVADEYGVQSFAAKGSESVPGLGPDATSLDFTGDFKALQVIKNVMRSKSVIVEFLGDAAIGDRASLAMIASQAIQKGVQGFGFEGIEGKYQVPMTMRDVADLHKLAALDMAEDAARGALKVWANEGRVGVMADLIPDGVQRLLRGAVTVESAHAIVDAIEGGRIGQFASEVGAHTFSRLLMDQGYDVNAPTVDAQASALGLTMIAPDIERGQYYGPVVGIDHRAALVKSSRNGAIDLPYAELKKGQEKPAKGDMVELKFAGGTLTVGLAKEKVKGGVGGR